MANLYTDIKLFDAEYYLANNPDVAAAIQGTDITAQDHYFLHGAAESLTGGTEDGSRAPNAWFNAAEYAAQNPDLAGVDANLLLAHFALHGVNEGRAPNAATAGEDGKIKPALLADYVNAEGNEDVKAAIAEITGTPVGAELTAEQAAIAAQHFFAYGINEDRKGGIADEISGDDGDVEEAIIEALEAYQAALTAQTDAVKAEKEVIKSAADKVDGLDATVNAEAAKTAVEKAVNAAGAEVVGKSGNTITGDVTDAKIANAEKALKAQIDAAQIKVDAQKENAAAVVTLQEKLTAQKQAVEDANKVNKAFEAEAAKFITLNGLDKAAFVGNSVNVGNFNLSFDDKGKLQVNAVQKNYKGNTKAFVDLGLNDAQKASGVWVQIVEKNTGGRTDNQDANAAGKGVALLDVATFKGFGAGTYTLAVNELTNDGKDSGKKIKEIKVTVTLDDKGNPVFSLSEEFNKLEGAAELVAKLQAVEANNAALAKANAAVEKAIIDALKADGYKPFEYESGAAKGDAIAWDKVKFDDNGQAVTLDKNGEVDKYLGFNKVDADGKPLNQDADKPVKAGAADDQHNPLYNPATQTKGEATVNENALDLTGSGLATSTLKDAAANSAKAVGELTDAQDALKAFQEAVESYNELKGLQTELADAAKDVEAAGKAVVEAEKAFADLDINLVKADEDGAASGDVYDEDDAEQFADLFVFSSGLKTVDNFDGDDLFYFGDAAVALIVADKANLAAGKQLGGEADVLEIFAVQDGANTVLYVEKEAFAGNSSNLVDEKNEDFVKIELVGVNAEDLQFNDGFLTLA